MKRLFNISYPTLGVEQVKILIPHSVYLQYMELPYDTKEDVSYAKSWLKKHTHDMEWFTEKSPYYEAISTGMYSCNLKQPIPIRVKEIN